MRNRSDSEMCSAEYNNEQKTLPILEMTGAVKCLINVIGKFMLR